MKNSRVLILKSKSRVLIIFWTFLNLGNENQKIGERMFGKNRSKKRTLFEVERTNVCKLMFSN